MLGSSWAQVGSTQAAGSLGCVVSGLVSVCVVWGSCPLFSLILGVERTWIRLLCTGDSADGGGGRVEGDGAGALAGKGLAASSGESLGPGLSGRSCSVHTSTLDILVRN